MTILVQGSFTSAGVAVNIPLPQSADYFVTRNLTQLATTQNPGRCVMAEWYRGQFSANDGLRYTKTNSTSALNVDWFSTTTASNGFTYVTDVPNVEAAQTGTAVTAASPAEVTINSHGYQNGDRVRLYNTTGMLQIAGMDFTVSSVATNTFELAGLDASGFAAPATAVTARRISLLDAVEPRFLYITNISQATQAVVTVSTAHNYVVGEVVNFSVSNDFGMQEINGLEAKVVSVGTYTMTVDLDTTGFTAFSFPTSANAQQSKLFATLAPAGQKVIYNPVSGLQTGYDFDYPPFHTGQQTPYMRLQAGVLSPAGSSNDVIVWQAYKSPVGLIS